MLLKPRHLLVLFVIVLIVLFLCTHQDGKENVEVKGIRSTQAVSAVPFEVDDKEHIPETTTTTTTVPTTTTTLPVTTSTTAAPKVSGSGVNWDAIADCESGNGTPGSANWFINTGNGYFGGLQFLHDTWIRYGGGRYAENANLTSRENQISIASGMGLGHWPNCGKFG